MKKMLLLLLILLLASPVALHAEEEKVLNILTWAEYIDYEDIIAPFEQETGVKIDYSFFDSNEEMLIKLDAVDAGTYDIVLASDYAIDIARKQGMLKELDKGKIPNYANINPVYLSQFYDPDNQFTVPYVAGTPLILYDPAMIDVEIDGYESLWDESLRDSIVIIDDARNIIGIVLKTLGESFNVTDPALLERAEEKLMALKPNVRVLSYDAQHLAMISGEAAVGYMFTPAVVWVQEERSGLEVVYPKEGMGFGIDNLFIPANAPHPDNAHQFLDFILRPEIGKSIAENQAYICVNQASDPLLSDEFKSNPALYIPDEILGTPEFIQDVGEAQSLYIDIWTRFKQH
ncbi:MAG: spermidine/putrescine ABC transporter substrate-binding protein [Clostridia bacterium]|nr:spermidine/putrescine ABC transporter substrate-binding protein [Clostridia bacterium]